MVGMADGAKPVRNDNTGSSFQHARDGTLYEEFRFGVYAAGGFIEHNHGRVCAQGADKTDELSLPYRQRAAPFHHIRGKAAGQATNKIVGTNLFRHRFNPRRIDVVGLHADIFLHRTGE